MGPCQISDNNPLNAPCVTPAVTCATDSSCQQSASINTSCPVIDTNNSPWDLSSQASDSCTIDGMIAESINVGGAKINVFKLLGIYEQGQLVDQTGNGNAISNGDIPNYPVSNAFDKYITEWRSQQLGTQITQSAFIGYDFGEIKLPNGRNRYGIETFVKRDVATIKIKQGCNKRNRVSKVRIERSSDGKKWYGVAILELPDCDGLMSLNFTKTVPSRWWRVRPVCFNGGSSDWWSVQALQLIDYEVTQQSNIQDRIFLENRDRQYCTESIEIKGTYTPLELQTFQSKFGMSQLFGGTETYSIEVSFSDVVGRLKRPLVIGDILSLPSEVQYSPTLQPILKYLEVTDIAWSSSGYTPNWRPTVQKILAEPVIASQETQDILGKLTENINSTGLIDIDDGIPDKIYQDISSISQTIIADHDTNVPERGEDYASETKFSKELYQWRDENYPQINLKPLDRIRNVYGLDAMPPNGLPFTYGDQYPPNPKDGAYHRLTYTYINDNIAPRLYKFSAAKNRWIYLATDKRFAHKNTNPILQEFLDPTESTRTNPADMNNAFK